MLANGEISPFTLVYGVALSVGIGILTAAFLIFPLEERVTNAKQVQVMTGVDPATFWLANITWDLVIYVVSMAIMCAILFPLDSKDTFSSSGAPGQLYEHILDLNKNVIVAI